VAVVVALARTRSVAVAVAVWPASRLAQGEVGREAVALDLLASLSSCSSVFAGCWG